ncbi:MAG: hypothetical protein K9J27_03425 [Bacteroidales bacterium]|nr:hypothetical protein [Bacteroidales bacterium]MCF8332826.1 hypothetical protein [Bacteroidales bacterium]
MKNIPLLIIIFIIGLSVQSQDSAIYRLAKMGEKVLSREPDSVRLPVHSKFKSRLDSLIMSHSDSLPVLDSIRNLSVLHTPDSSVRIITWQYPFNNGAYKFYGYLQYFHPGDSSWKIRKLQDHHKEIQEPENAVLKPGQWYGALYYDLVVRDNYITLLGWNGYHNQMNQKVIEILHFNDNGEPVFGKKVFTDYTNDSARRVILKYSNDVAISLKYDRILREVKKPRENRLMQGYRTEQIKQRMIYFNKLDPIQPMFEGDYRYYVPLSEKMQGFHSKNGRWVFIENVVILSEQPTEEGQGSLDFNLFPDRK